MYSLALGVQMHSGTPDQIEFVGGKIAPGATATATVLDTTGTPITPQFFYRPNFGVGGTNASGSLDTLVSQFQPGDLLSMGDRLVLDRRLGGLLGTGCEPASADPRRCRAGAAR